MAAKERRSRDASNPIPTLAKLVEMLWELQETRTPIGTIVPFGSSDEKSLNRDWPGWLFCHGQSVSAIEYGSLYKVIGTSFGALDRDHFNLPDLRGRFVRGVDGESGRDPGRNQRAPSEKDGNQGNKVGSVQDDSVRKHTHRHHPGTGKNWFRNYKDTDGTWPSEKDGNGALQETEEEGKGIGDETRPKNIYLEWIIYAGQTLTPEQQVLLKEMRKMANG